MDSAVRSQTGLPQSYIQGQPFEKWRLQHLSRNKSADAAHLALYQLQDKSPEEMVMGAAVLFTTLAMKVGMDPQELHTIAMRVLSAPDEGDFRTGNSLQALRDFASIRVAGKDTNIV